MIQAARSVKAAALMQVEPGVGAGGERVLVGVEDRRLAEGVVDVAFDDVARVVKERNHIIVGILHHVQAFVQGTVAVAIAVPATAGRFL
ncbi:MAG: hypothetical protein KatS3mg109_0579 [Pirellulaceae bacterium]|nr:MAG: hypothetical protein KatS3mg109_0579 [Pirellulaceae bacterium]